MSVINNKFSIIIWNNKQYKPRAIIINNTGIIGHCKSPKKIYGILTSDKKNNPFRDIDKKIMKKYFSGNAFQIGEIGFCIKPNNMKEVESDNSDSDSDSDPVLSKINDDTESHHSNENEIYRKKLLDYVTRYVDKKNKNDIYITKISDNRFDFMFWGHHISIIDITDDYTNETCYYIINLKENIHEYDLSKIILNKYMCIIMYTENYMDEYHYEYKFDNIELYRKFCNYMCGYEPFHRKLNYFSDTNERLFGISSNDKKKHYPLIRKYDMLYYIGNNMILDSNIFKQIQTKIPVMMSWYNFTNLYKKDIVINFKNKHSLIDCSEIKEMISVM